MKGGGDCEDKGVGAALYWRELCSGPGPFTEASTWEHPALQAAQTMALQWYRVLIVTWAVSAAAIQGAASASVSNGVACHINAVAVPHVDMKTTVPGMPGLRTGTFTDTPVPPGLPVLFMEGTGNFCGVVTPGFVPKHGSTCMNTLKQLKAAKPELFEGHDFPPYLFASQAGEVPFFKWAVSAYSYAHNHVTDLYFRDKTTAEDVYGVPFDRFILGAAQGGWQLEPQHTYTDHELDACSDSNSSFWAPSSQEAGDPHPDIQAAIADVAYGDSETPNYCDICVPVEKLEGATAKARTLMKMEDVAMIRGYGYAFTQADQLFRMRVWVK